MNSIKKSIIILFLLNFGNIYGQNSNFKNIKEHTFLQTDRTYGFDIIVDGKCLIHQTTIPGIPGKTGFFSQTDANKVAQLMAQKIKNGIMPPTITEEELKKLNIKTKL